MMRTGIEYIEIENKWQKAKCGTKLSSREGWIEGIGMCSNKIVEHFVCISHE